MVLKPWSSNRVTFEPGEKAYRFYGASWETCDAAAHCVKHTQPLLLALSAPPRPNEPSRNSTRMYLCWGHHSVASRVSSVGEDGRLQQAVVTRLRHAYLQTCT